MGAFRHPRRTRFALVAIFVACITGSAVALPLRSTDEAVDRGSEPVLDRGSEPATDVRTLVVALEGDDAGNGTADRPLRTIEEAISRARGRTVIELGNGRWPAVRDTTKRSASLTIRGNGPGRTMLGGLNLFGARKIRVERVTVEGPTVVSTHPTLGPQQTAADVTLSQSEFTLPQRSAGPAGVCIAIRSGSSRVRVELSYVHDCRSGITGPKTPIPSDHITIDNNVLERFSDDAVQFGGWHRVRIERNTIRDAVDPKGVVHNDGIQLTGPSRHVRIARNTITRSGGQLVLVQARFGPITDVVMENNAISHSRAWGIQVQGVRRLRFVHNTLWHTDIGGLLIRNGPNGAPTQGAIVANNILSRMAVIEKSQGVIRSRNLLGENRGQAPGRRDFVAPNPGFLGPDDLRVKPSSPARRRADRRYRLSRDRDGRRRPPRATVGAYE